MLKYLLLLTRDYLLNGMQKMNTNKVKITNNNKYRNITCSAFLLNFCVIQLSFGSTIK